VQVIPCEHRDAHRFPVKVRRCHALQPFCCSCAGLRSGPAQRAIFADRATVPRGSSHVSTQTCTDPQTGAGPASAPRQGWERRRLGSKSRRFTKHRWSSRDLAPRQRLAHRRGTHPNFLVLLRWPSPPTVPLYRGDDPPQARRSLPFPRQGASRKPSAAPGEENRAASRPEARFAPQTRVGAAPPRVAPPVAAHTTLQLLQSGIAAWVGPPSTANRQFVLYQRRSALRSDLLRCPDAPGCVVEGDEPGRGLRLEQ
jgi:hypothetical protein